MNLRDGARLVKKGGVVAYPTETLYGLGADPENKKALRRILKIKGRDAGKGILILVSSSRDLKKWAVGVGQRERILIRKFWPGPLTLVFRAKNGVPKELTGGTGKIGIRISSNKTARKLCRAVGGALTSTSANFSGEPSLRRWSEVRKYLGLLVDGVVSNENLKTSKGSTVLDVSNLNIKVIREGKIPVKKIRSFLKSPKGA